MVSDTLLDPGVDVVTSVSNPGALGPVIDWAGDQFYKNHVESKTYTGYHTALGENGQTVSLPFSVTVQRNDSQLDAAAVFSGVLIILVAVTIFTCIRSLFRR